jgi:lipopolysaccharide transport system ATP-binding protein
LLRALIGRPTTTTPASLANIDWEVGKGQSWGVIGANGAGKSTLLKLVAGVTSPTSGRVHRSGRVAALLELGAGFHPDYSGLENIELVSTLMGISVAEMRAKTESIIGFADIGPSIANPVRTYSTGMAVRLGFAIATAYSPDLLITDEVLAVGDENFQKKCMRWMERYRADGGALILCSHSMYHVQSLCDHALWLQDGRENMRGDAFSVTQAYIAHQEAQSPASASDLHIASADSATCASVEKLWATNHSGAAADTFAMGEDILIEGILHAPDDVAPVVMVGVARIDLTPIYGTLSLDADFTPKRESERTFRFALRIRKTALLPGRYFVKAHALDEFGLRLYDTRAIEITITGKSREHGLVRLDCSWE